MIDQINESQADPSEQLNYDLEPVRIPSHGYRTTQQNEEMEQTEELKVVYQTSPWKDQYHRTERAPTVENDLTTMTTQTDVNPKLRHNITISGKRGIPRPEVDQSSYIQPSVVQHESNRDTKHGTESKESKHNPSQKGTMTMTQTQRVGSSDQMDINDLFEATVVETVLVKMAPRISDDLREDVVAYLDDV